jgi:hypothetical protein
MRRVTPRQCDTFVAAQQKDLDGRPYESLISPVKSLKYAITY